MSEETVKMPDAASPSVSPAVQPELQEVDVVPASPANVVTNGYADEAEKPGETLPQEGVDCQRRWKWPKKIWLLMMSLTAMMEGFTGG